MRYSLRFLVVAIFVIACVLAWGMRPAARFYKQSTLASAIKAGGGEAGYEEQLSYDPIAGRLIPSSRDTNILIELANGSSLSPRMTSVSLSEQASLEDVKLLRNAPGILSVEIVGEWFDEHCARELAKNKGLISVKLYRCNLSAEMMNELSGLEELVRISLLNCAATDACLLELASFNSLRSVNIAEKTSRNLTDAGIRSLTHVGKLDSVSLVGFPQISSKSIIDLAASRDLSSLELWFVPVEDDFLASLGTNSSIKRLVLKSGNITDDGVTSLAGNTSIQELRFSDSAVSDRCVSAVADLSGLRSVTFLGTNLTQDGVDKLMSLRPELHIGYMQ